MNNPQKDLQDRIRQIFEASGLKKRQFADKSNITASYVGHIVNGTYTGDISDRVIHSICKAFGYNYHWLKTGEGKMMFVENPRFQSVEGSILLGVPILGRWSEGDPAIICEGIQEYAPMRAVEGGRAFVLKEGGMAPRFVPGDYISFVPGSSYQVGDLVIVTDQFGDFLIRYLKEADGKRWLVAETATYPPIEADGYGYAIRGKLHEAVRPLV